MGRLDQYRATHVRETVTATGARTASGNSGPLTGYESAKYARVQLNVTAVTGTSPSMTVIVEDSIDNGANFNTLVSFTAVTAPGRQVLNINPPFGSILRVSWTITGTTPSFTFTVDMATQA